MADNIKTNGNNPVKEGKRGPGRPPGMQNKTTKLLKDAIILAAQDVGEDQRGKDGLIGYCRFLAKDEPKAFTQLLGKVLPTQVAGPDDEDGLPTKIEFVLVKSESSST